MADNSNKCPENVTGKFYIDQECIDCGLCIDVAPNNIKHSDEGYCFIAKQPENDEETNACQEAVESCPVSAIGDDGDEE